MKRVVSYCALAGLILVSMLLLQGCGKSTKIGDIVDKPSDYQGKEVSIEGTVGKANWFPLLGKGTYQVGDGSGSIWVITNEPPPQEGAKVALKGKVQSAITVGTESYGISIAETSRD